jgi:N-acetylglutamate synthase-like GNAT family acetyltransferase
MITDTDISIRTTLQPGDIGYVIHMHGRIYKQEYNYGIAFETYVAAGLHEFYRQYDPVRDGVWICEHNERIVGFLLLVHRGEAAQLRYFILEPEYRGFGIGDKLMQLFIAHFKQQGYTSAYLWTTDELPAAAHLYMKYGFRLTEEKASEAFGKRLKEQRYDFTVQ